MKESLQDTSAYINRVISKLPKDDLLHQFAVIFLKTFSNRTFHNLSEAQISQMVEERFRFFKKGIENGGDFRIYNPKMSNQTIFEAIYSDVSHLLLTIENLLREFNVRVTIKLHPIVGIKKNKAGKLHKITLPDESQTLMSMIYIEFEEIEDESVLAELNSRTKAHICAVNLVHENSEALFAKINEVHKKIEKEKSISASDKEDWLDLLNWLSISNFSCFGYVQYPTKVKEGKALAPLEGTALGIFNSKYLSQDSFHLIENLNAHIWKLRSSSPFAFDTVRVKSPVQRFEDLMRLSIRLPEGKKVIEHTFVGLLRRSSLMSRSQETPLVRQKMQQIFNAEKMIAGSYKYNEVIRIFNAIPKFELFRTSTTTLHQMVKDLLSINDPNTISCFTQRCKEQKRLFLLVAIPTRLFTPEHIEVTTNYLKHEIPHSDSEFIEVLGDSICRLHVYFDLQGDGNWSPDLSKLEREIGDLIQTWETRVRNTMYQQFPSALTEQICQKYLPLLPNHYKIRSHPNDTVRDMMFLEKISHEHPIHFNLLAFDVSSSGMKRPVSLLYIYSYNKMDLIAVMPILQNMGLYVIDQLTTRIGDGKVTIGYIQSFRITRKDGTRINEKEYKSLLGDLLLAVFHGQTENDPLNALALFAKLDWRAINVMMLYRNFYLQLGASFSLEKINRTLLEYPQLTRLLYEYFQNKFSTESSFGEIDYRKEVLLPKVKQEYIEALSQVEAIADDIILRNLLNLIESTLRTNFYIPKSNQETFISIKVDSQQVLQMPIPKPYREIYVHDVGMEGTHLRFGSVARGGLRWSDRLDDFRTEILGLVKTQQTKNVVIVPVGSKGGFIIKAQHDTREEIFKESQKQYRKFISALLDITDNMDSSRQVKHPNDVVIYDQSDPYLVVAADKGTATFSDTANEISNRYDFWMGDGFASGGSVGYDHKKEGITARGAWECVKLHFREIGKDIQTEHTTVAGIGDMGGDVFGNGMLLSKALKLQAAFNHMHIFLDPDPDPIESWQERKRLFELPRSTWKDYSLSLLSEGGGIFDRKAKEIRLSPQIKKMLGVTENVLNGEQLIRTILTMQVDLFWFGGIGTYIKASNENNMRVGDQANDAIRIETSEFNATVIGEGANLGMTQLARIELNKRGVKLNTDAIDNSAGVNMSDYEVNIKILLQQFLQRNVLSSQSERNQLLKEATDEVSILVLANNRGQHRLISMDQIRSLQQFKLFRKLIDYLVAKGMNARSEFIPKESELKQIEYSDIPMPRAVLAILQAYVKMNIFDTLLSSSLLDDDWLEARYRKYLPKTIVERFGNEVSLHPLKKEIIGTVLTNQMVNQGGSLFFYHVEQLTGKSVVDIAKAYLILDASLDGASFRKEVLYVDGVTEHHKYEAFIAHENLLQILVQYALQLSTEPLQFSMIDSYVSIFSELKEVLKKSTNLDQFSQQWQQKGFQKEFANRIAMFQLLEVAPDVMYLHQKEELSIELALKLAMTVNDIFQFEWLKEKVLVTELENEWELSHQEILLQTIESYKYHLIRFLLHHHQKADLENINSQELLLPIQEKFPSAFENYFHTLEQLKLGTPLTLTTLTVSINRLNFLERS